MGPSMLSNKLLDVRGNKIDGWSINEKRGNILYSPPLGWIGFGIKCKEMYKDEIWIGNNNSIGEWNVAYHGVGRGQISENVKKIIGLIIKGGLKPGKGQTHKYCRDIFHYGNLVGEGVYCCPNIKSAEPYAGISEINGILFKTVLMLRVRPDAIRGCNCLVSGNSWVVNGTTNEVRPYRILYKKVDG